MSNKGSDTPSEKEFRREGWHAVDTAPTGLQLLKEKEGFFFYTDRETQMAETRLYHEDFLQNSRHGQLLLNRIKNKRDTELFGSMSPRVDDVPLGAVVSRMNGILKELRWQRWVLVVASIIIAAILLFKS